MDFLKIQKKWQKRWEKDDIFKPKETGKKYYVLEMFAYPSGVAAHVGHARNYIIGDSFARFKRMQGFNVMYPMGWDAFGLPTENAAIEKGMHPYESIKQSITTFKDQLDMLSLSYDWTREINTSDPDYYKWTQWLFLKMLEKKLAYKKNAIGNWCPGCKTTLANEDVKQGKCWRCDSDVEQKEIEQWFFKITEYADKLLKDIDGLKWSNRLKTMQKNWIGKSKGTNLFFEIKGMKEKIETFTTRPDTYFGITFMAIAAEHPLVPKLIGKDKKLQKFVDEVKNLSEMERMTKDKKGMFTGHYAINPVTGEEIQLWVANYVVSSYGTGIVIAVPTHDQRDFEFAKEYDIPMKVVIKPEKGEAPENRAYTKEGVMVNSDKFNGMKNNEARDAITDFLIEKKYAKRVTNYKIRDWNVSRQRYWGAPIPIIYCDKCGTVPVPEKDLPVKLPLDVKFGKKGAPPLATNEGFVKVNCPKCKGSARRETDTMTTFVDSSWYYLRYCSPKSKDIFDKKKVNHWMPVDQYIGGAEHAVGHLLYARFITKFLKDLGYVDFDEPFIRLLNQGMVLKDGVKMSKSKGNTVDPRPIIKEHGLDVLRTYMLSMAHPTKALEWSDKEMFGAKKLLDRVVKLSDETKDKKDKYIESVAQKKISKITKLIEELELNTAMIELNDFVGKLTKYPSSHAYEIFLKLLTPFAPHTCEEMWEKIGNKNLISKEKWPEVNEKLIDEAFEKQIEAVQKIFEDINHIIKIVDKKPKKIIIYAIPKDVNGYKNVQKELEEEFSCTIEIYASNDKKAYDPEGKAKKAKPGKPGILIE